MKSNLALENDGLENDRLTNNGLCQCGGSYTTLPGIYSANSLGIAIN